MTRDGAMLSLWQEQLGQYQPSNAWDKSVTYDVLIVGGGITGLTTGLFLQQQGKKCLIAEAHNIGFGTTGGTTAHLNTMLDTTYPEIESAFSEDVAKQIANATKEAIITIESISKQYNIDCGFEYKKGYLFALEKEQSKELKEIKVAAERAGVSIEYTKEIPVPIPFEKAVVFEGQAQFNIAEYLLGLANAFEAGGGVILQNCLVSDVESKEHHVAKTSIGDIKADKVVYATHIPPGVNILHFRCAPYRSYVAAFTLKSGEYPDALCYDMEDPYHYYRTQEIHGKKYIIAGGYDHKTGHEENTESCFRELESYLRTYFDIDSIDYKWSSQYYSSTDGLPYIGKFPGHDTIYCATGFIGNGMVFGTLAGRMITDMILGKEHELESVLAPSRIKPIAGFTEFVKENAAVVSKFIGMRFSYTTIETLAELAKGEACLADWEDKKVALYKDENGKVHALDPVCPHAKCIVAWNTAEKTWDCPCHGGRFACNGALLTGPPRRGLTQIITEHIDGD